MRKRHYPPRDPFVFIVLTVPESARTLYIAKAEQAGVPFQQWALNLLENA